MEKIEYKIEKDKDFAGERFESYTIEKIIIHNNGDKEHRFRVVYPFFDGDINTMDFDKLEFKKPITTEEWNLLSPEYRKAWCNGTLNEELSKELEELRAKEGVA